MTVAVLTILEGAARFAAPVAPEWQPGDAPGVIMNGHPTRLWGMSPGVQNNAGARATINASGLRGPLPVVPRPAGHQRVMVLGDSSFFGHGVEDDSTIPVRLGEALTERGIAVDTVNGAIPGYSTEQSLLLLDELGWSLEPTLLVLANLWSDNSADGFRDADLLRTTRVFRENPLSGSALFRLTAGWIDQLRGGGGGRIITWTRESAWPEDGQRRVPLGDYARNLDTMAREAAARGVGVVFLAPANVGIARGDVPPGASWDPYFEAQAAVAAWHGSPVVSARVAMQGAAVDTLFVDAMHPSAEGARILATAVADALVAEDWPRNRLLARGEAFDPSGLVDTTASRAGIQERAHSPQAQLFPGVVEPSMPEDMPREEDVPRSVPVRAAVP